MVDISNEDYLKKAKDYETYLENREDYGSYEAIGRAFGQLLKRQKILKKLI